MLFEDGCEGVFMLGMATSRLLELSIDSGILGSGNATALSIARVDDSVSVDSDELSDFFCIEETVLLYERKDDSFLWSDKNMICRAS